MAVYTSAYKGRASRAVSYVGILLNFLLLVLSGAVVGFGIWMIVHGAVTVMSTVLPSNDFWDYMAYGLVTVGCVQLVASILAIAAFFRESRPALLVYAFFAILVFIGASIFIGLPFWYKEEVRRDLYLNMEESLSAYQGEGHSDHDSVFWNYVQTNYRCCGVDGEQDYRFTAWSYKVTTSSLYIPTLGNVTRRYPASCCRYYHLNAPSLKTLQGGDWVINPVRLADCYRYNPNPHPDHSFDEGCYLHVKGFLLTNMTLMGCLAIALELITVLLFFMAIFVFAANARREN